VGIREPQSAHSESDPPSLWAVALTLLATPPIALRRRFPLAYRIVQEALTNTLKHAQASSATVLVRYTGDAVEVEVVDDGRGPTTDLRDRVQAVVLAYEAGLVRPGAPG
jgi:signal transduction histidine kinase